VQTAFENGSYTRHAIQCILEDSLIRVTLK